MIFKKIIQHYIIGIMLVGTSLQALSDDELLGLYYQQLEALEDCRLFRTIEKPVSEEHVSDKVLISLGRNCECAYQFKQDRKSVV